MTNHTPMPWHLKLCSNSAGHGNLLVRPGCIQEHLHIVPAADAEYIVKCVNYHDRLVAAIKELADNGDVGMWSKKYQSAVNDAKALLAELSAHNGGEG